MTYLALECSRYINGVAMRHGEVSRDMYPAYPVQSITNGVHAPTWTSKPFQKLFDEYIPDWRADNQYLRYTIGIPLELIRQAHLEAKRELLAEVKKAGGRGVEGRRLHGRVRAPGPRPTNGRTCCSRIQTGCGRSPRQPEECRSSSGGKGASAGCPGQGADPSHL